MNWKNIKNFMLILLVAVNVFLAAMLIRQVTLKTYDNETVKNARELLSHSGIIADKKFITLSPEPADLYTCNVNEDYVTGVANRIITSYSDVFWTPNGASFYGEDGKLEIQNGFDISYSSDQFILPTESGSKMNEKELDKLKGLLSAILGNTSENEYKFSTDEALEFSKTKFIKVTQTLDGLPIENHSLECYFEDGRLVYLSGRWCFLPTNEKKSAHLLDCVNILFIEKNELDAQKSTTTEEYPSTPSPMTVKKANICYLSFFSEEDSALYFIPSWHLEWEGSSVNDTYYNALNGSKIKIK
ncbi:MAG: hypothetical protein E7671_00460 [Ruminococcaceae bacterium]|nr:hypothetical protein [Oscillospiraceae bacterium]